MHNKDKRLKAIKELIKKYPIEDQHELVEKLHNLYGIETTQSIVSRDLRLLGIGKRTVQGRMVYELTNQDVHRDILCNAIIDIAHNETMIVIKTMPALADFTAEFIDQQELPEVLGTMAGENTVFVIPSSIKKITEVYETLCKTLFFKIKKDLA